MSPHLVLFAAAVAVLCPWLPKQWRFGGAAAAVLTLVGIGLFVGALTPPALPGLAALFATAWWAGSGHPGRAAGWVLFAVVALGIGLGLWPGFHRVVLTEPLPIKAGSIPYSLQFGLGKPLVAVALLLWLVPVAQSWSALRSSVVAALPVIAVTAISIPLLAWGAGHVRVAPELPPPSITVTWIAINLLFVCTAEEAFFRGAVQRTLALHVAPGVAIVCAAGLFGLAHLPGGWTYAMLATAAGLGYGVAYHRAGQRIEAAVFAHFGVNLTHFAAFTYPAG